MRLPRHVSPAARARRSLLIDVLCAIALAAAAIALAAGIGVVGFFALITVLVLGLWLALEGGARRALGRLRSRRAATDGPR